MPGVTQPNRGIVSLEIQSYLLKFYPALVSRDALKTILTLCIKYFKWIETDFPSEKICFPVWNSRVVQQMQRNGLITFGSESAPDTP